MTIIAKKPVTRHRYVNTHAREITQLNAFEDTSRSLWGEILVDFINLPEGKRMLASGQAMQASDLSWELLVCDTSAPMTFVCYRVQTQSIRKRADDRVQG